MIRQWDRNGFYKPSPHGRLVLLSFPDIIGPFQPAILPSPVQGDLPRASWRGKRPGAAAVFLPRWQWKILHLQSGYNVS